MKKGNKQVQILSSKSLIIKVTEIEQKMEDIASRDNF